MLRRVFKRAYRSGFTLGEYDLETEAEKAELSVGQLSSTQPNPTHCQVN